jgi:hypothetical protein
MNRWKLPTAIESGRMHTRTVRTVSPCRNGAASSEIRAPARMLWPAGQGDACARAVPTAVTAAIAAQSALRPPTITAASD